MQDQASLEPPFAILPFLRPSGRIAGYGDEKCLILKQWKVSGKVVYFLGCFARDGEADLAKYNLLPVTFSHYLPLLGESDSRMIVLCRHLIPFGGVRKRFGIVLKLVGASTISRSISRSTSTYRTGAG